MRAFVRFAILVIALVGLQIGVAGGVSNEMAILSSKDKVVNYLVPNVQTVSVQVFQKTSASNFVVLVYVTKYMTNEFASIDEVDSFASGLVAEALKKVLQNNSPYLQKDKEVIVDIDCQRADWDFGAIVFQKRQQVAFVKTAEIYTVPPVKVEMDLPTEIPIFVFCGWARIEIGLNEVTLPFQILDERIDPGKPARDQFYGHLLVPSYLVGNTNFWAKIYTFTDMYEIFDQSGKPQTEKTFAINTSKVSGGMRFQVSGGSPGRSFVVEVSADLHNWVPVQKDFFVPSITTVDPVVSIDTQFSTESPRGFYRIRTTSVCPD
jgi:hypothetical protein